MVVRQSIGVWCLLLFACDRGDKPSPPPETVSTGAVKSAAVAPPPASAVAPVAAAPSAAPAAPQPAVTKPGTLRLSIVADGELLKTEQNRADTLVKVLEKAGRTVTATAVSEDERAYAKALAEQPATPPALAASWAGFETVVLIRMEPPQTRGGQKISAGRSHLVIVHPPAQEPAFSAIYTNFPGYGGPSTDPGPLGTWLQAHLKLREKGKTP